MEAAPIWSRKKIVNFAVAAALIIVPVILFEVVLNYKNYCPEWGFKNNSICVLGGVDVGGFMSLTFIIGGLYSLFVAPIFAVLWLASVAGVTVFSIWRRKNP